MPSLAPSEFTNARGYLDTTTFGLPPTRTIQALETAVGDWAARADWMKWEEDGERCRELFAELSGVGAAQVALMPAAAVAAGAVAASLPAQRGDNVVVHADDPDRILTFRLHPDGSGSGVGPHGATHHRFRSWKQALHRGGDPPAGRP